MTKKLFFFDFDGTIADSLEVALEVLQEIAPILNMPIPSREDLMDWRTKGVMELMQLTGISVFQVPKIVKLARESFNSKSENVPLIEGIEDVILTLAEQGHEMHIISTNGEENIRYVLRKHNIALFAGIHTPSALFGKDTVIQKIRKKLGFLQQHTYMIGDEVRDIEAAKKAGVHSVGVTWGFNHTDLLIAAKPDFLIENVADLVLL